MAAATLHLGTVATFEPAAGLGTVRDQDGTELSFHCTAISDGTRTIEVGTSVTFLVTPTHGGALEARPLTPLPGK